MYDVQLEQLIDAALADGILTEKEKQILFKKAQSMGIDLDEFEMVLDARLFEKKSSKKTNQLGERLKCPNCGQDVNPGDSVCPYCGFAFSGIEASESSKKLAELLEKFNKKNPIPQLKTTSNIFNENNLKMEWLNAHVNRAKKKMEIITSFPVPNNRIDLIDLLTAIQPLADSKASKKGLTGYNTYNPREELGYAYWVLYSNCINKAKISFLNDSAFSNFFSFFEEKNQPSKGFLAKLFGK